MSREMRVRVFEKDERVPQRWESLQPGGDAIDVSAGEEQQSRSHGETEADE